MGVRITDIDVPKKARVLIFIHMIDNLSFHDCGVVNRIHHGLKNARAAQSFIVCDGDIDQLRAARRDVVLVFLPYVRDEGQQRVECLHGSAEAER